MIKLTPFNSGFKNNLFILMGGMAIAQAIPILFSPLLTRLYTPAEFGYFATFIAVSSFFTVVMSGKYELAIILPKKDHDAINILFLSALLSFAIALISSGILLLFSKKFSNFFNLSEIESIVWLIPLLSFLATIYLLFNEWSIRKNNFIFLSRNKIINTSGITAYSIIFGLKKISFGLIFGQLFGYFTVSMFSIYRVIKYDKNLFNYVRIHKMRFLAKRYLDFVKFNIPGQLINSLAVQLPVFFISFHFGASEVGYYALADRVLGVPLSFLGNSFKDVFKQKAASEYKEKGNCYDIFKKTTFYLFFISIIPFLALFIFSPTLFAGVFGEKWLTSGEFTRTLSLMYILSFVSMPTSCIFVIAEKQKLDLLWQSMFLVFTVVSLGVGYVLNNIYCALWSFCIGRSIIYIIQIVMTFHLSKGIRKA